MLHGPQLLSWQETRQDLGVPESAALVMPLLYVLILRVQIHFVPIQRQPSDAFPMACMILIAATKATVNGGAFLRST